MPRKHGAIVAFAGVIAVCACPLLIHAAVINAQLPAASSVSGTICVALVARFAGVRLRIAIALGLVSGIVLAYCQAQWMLYLSPIVINVALMLLFGQTLLPGRQPMISRFASLEQGALTAELARYTRWLTWGWAVLFAFMAATAAALSAFASIETWSLFTNVVSYALVALLFVGEFAWRHVRFPEMRHASPVQLVRLIRRSGVLMRQR